MSNTHPSSPLVASLPETKRSKIRNRVAKVRTSVTKHKKPLIAVAALTALVGGSAYLGRTTADKTVVLEIVDVEEDETTDTKSA